MDAEHALKVAVVAGARPNFMKVAPVLKEFERWPEFDVSLIHSGQHYDYEMSQAFFDDLTMREPDAFLGVGSGAHGEQTAKVLTAFEAWLLEHPVDLVLVVGDVNSTLACALAASKLGIRVAHVEAGLRAFDRTMPEEINRLLTDRLADVLLTPSEDADANLLREGIDPAQIHLVGNVMIDALAAHEQRARDTDTPAKLGLAADTPFVLVTLHRPSNVDDPEVFRGIARALAELSTSHKVIFPVHPRTRARIAEHAVDVGDTLLVEPQGYVDFLSLEMKANLVLTDSGGVQEETTYLGVPCLTLRANTERPITVERGTNKVIGSDGARIIEESARALGRGAPSVRPTIPLWDGQTAGRIVAAIR